MSLLDSIINASVVSVMANSQALAHTNSTTLAQAGTSLPTIQSNMLGSAQQSVNLSSASSSLFAPITSMQAYAIANTPGAGEQAAINNAATVSISQMDSAFTSSLPGSNYGLFDIQNASSQALSSGVNSFSNSLQSINPSVVSSATSVGNTALTSAAQASDNVCTSTYNAASQSLNGQLSSVNSALASNVTSQNAASAASAAASATGTGAASTAAGGVVNNGGSDVFQTNGIFQGTEGAASTVDNTTDVIYQNIKLYVEGIQVPFEDISISQTMGELPSAYFSIPPQAGLMDIARYYQPKVHIFFTDNNLGGDRLLFWGHIIAPNYTKSRSAGMATIGFRCVHKNNLIHQLMLDYTGYVSNATTNVTNPNDNDAVAKINNLNSTQSLIDALKGITSMQTQDTDLIDPSNTDILNADVTKLAQRWSKFQNRYVGMPASIMNMWNQLKKACYTDTSLNTILSRIYIPLLEDGIGFFDRLSGHYYLENIIQTTKQAYCAEAGTSTSAASTVAMVPPAYRLPSVSAISSTLGVEVISNTLGFSGELTDFYQLFSQFYQAFEYEMVTLASPASVPVDPTVTISPDSPSIAATTPMMAVETIIKPQTPFYYSPKCNVLFPKMYSEVSITQEEEIIPTRLTAFHPSLPVNAQGFGTNYRGPQSIRESIAVGAALVESETFASTPETGSPSTPASDINLLNTTGQSFNVPGKYEQGRGLKPMKIVMPQWLAQLTKGRTADNDPTTEVWPAQGTVDYQNLLNLYAAWVDRYGYDIVVDDNGVPSKVRNTNKDRLNPYSTQAGIAAFQRLLFASVDYEYTKLAAQARSGMILGIFNPYIIPGYPMDVLSESPNDPSFHGVCSSVTHSITSRSIQTTIGMVGAMTYSEMSNYYIQPLHPWLQTALNMINVTYGAQTSAAPSGFNSPQVYANTANPSSDTQEYGDVSNVTSVRQTLIGNSNAAITAGTFYQSVLGIGAAAPDDIYDFANGQGIPISRTSGAWSQGSPTSLTLPNGGEANDYLTAVGNLRLVSRPIEGKQAIQNKYQISFVDLTPANYGTSAEQYQNPVLSADLLLEPGASMFLDYDETDVFIGDSWDNQTLRSTSLKSQIT